MTTLNLETIIQWGPTKEVCTRNGKKLLRKGKPTDDFRAAWKNGGKQSLKSAGISWGPGLRGDFGEVCWWMPITKEFVQATEAAIASSRATESSVHVPCPAGLEWLPFQRAGIAYALAHKNVLIADEMGLGKTLQTIGIINSDESIRKVLVVCPNTLKLNWQRELQRWLVRPMSIGIVSGSDWQKTDVVLINYDIATKHAKNLIETQWDLMVCDEAHYCKNPKAQRTRALFGDRDNAPIKAQRKVALTGTPIFNRPIELFPILHWLQPERWRNLYAYAHRYCAATRTQWGWDFSGASNLSELQTELRSSCMIRRLKKDVLTELPAKRRQIIEIELDGAAMDAERAWASGGGAALDEAESQVLFAEASDDPKAFEAAVEKLQAAKQIAFEEMGKIRHATALAKLPQVIEHIQNVLDTGAKVVVFAHHQDVVRGIQAAVGGLTITGETPTDERQANVDKFQNDPETKIIICSIKAAGVGITLTASSHVVFAELDWTPGSIAQAEDRCHRIGQTNPVLVQAIVASGTIDAHLAKTIVRKLKIIDAALDTNGATSPALEIQGQITYTPTEAKAQGPEVNKEYARTILEGLNIIKNQCDGARRLDGHGFSKFDAPTGRLIAGKTELNAKQAEIGLRLCRKYRRQLPDRITSALNIGAKEDEQ